MVVSITCTSGCGYHLPSNPGGYRAGLPSAFIEKIVVSHRPVGYSSPGGDANSFSAGVGVGEYPPFVWTLTECQTLRSSKGMLAFHIGPLLPPIAWLY